MKTNADREVTNGQWPHNTLQFADSPYEYLLGSRVDGTGIFLQDEDCLRAVLTWNACRGISGDKLRRVIAGKEPFSSMRALVVDVERDEILKVMRRLVESMARPTASNSFAGSRQKQNAFDDAIALLRKYRNG